jgi:hypothetical protein
LKPWSFSPPVSATMPSLNFEAAVDAAELPAAPMANAVNAATKAATTDNLMKTFTKPSFCY